MRAFVATILICAGFFFKTAPLRAQSVQAANASFVWVNEPGGASGNVPDFVVDNSGNCYAICHFNSTNANVGGIMLTNSNPGTYDSFVVKYNSRRQVQWLQQFSGNASDFGLALAVDSTGSTYVVGNFYSTVLTVAGLSVTNSTGTSSSDIFFAKFDANGNIQWLRSFGGNGIDTAFHVMVDHNDDVIVTGSFFSTTIAFDSITLTDSGDSDIFLAKFNSSGQTIWAERAGGTKADSAYRMAIDSGNNIYLTGYYHSPASFGSINVGSAGGFDAYLAKFDSSGNALWVVTGGGTGTDEGYSVALDNAGNSFITGYFASASANFGGQVIKSAGGNDIFTAKVSPSGAVLWARSAGGTGDDGGRAIATDAQGNAYVAAYFSSTATFGNVSLTSVGGEDLAIIKYDVNGNVKWVIPAGGPTNDPANHIAVDSYGHLYISGQCSSNTVFGNSIVENTLNNSLFIARLDFRPPLLNIGFSNGFPTISWDTNYLTPIIPQSSVDLINWQDLTNPPSQQDGTNSITITNLPGGPPEFYRLRNTE